MLNSSTHIKFKDGTSTAAAQPVIETTAPSSNLAAIMANWVLVSAPVERVSHPAAEPPGTR
jgi:hypothetical protein